MSESRPLGAIANLAIDDDGVEGRVVGRRRRHQRFRLPQPHPLLLLKTVTQRLLSTHSQGDDGLYQGHVFLPV